jgi:hypothetical protein
LRIPRTNAGERFWSALSASLRRPAHVSNRFGRNSFEGRRNRKPMNSSNERVNAAPALVALLGWAMASSSPCFCTSELVAGP